MITKDQLALDRIRKYQGDLEADLKFLIRKDKIELKVQLEKLLKDISLILYFEDDGLKGKQLFTVKEAAEYWGLSESGVRKDIKAGKVKTKKDTNNNIRISKSELVGRFMSFNLSTDNLVICTQDRELKDENGDVTYKFKSHTFYRLVYSGEFIMVLFALKEKIHVITGKDRYNSDFRLANDEEKDAIIYNLIDFD
jgi:hypothetical protein